MFYFSTEILCCVSGYQIKAYNIFTFIKKIYKYKKKQIFMWIL